MRVTGHWPRKSFLVQALAVLLVVGLPVHSGAPIGSRSNTGPIIYVSPSGSDSNPGTETAPVQTLSKAQQIVESMDSDMSADLTVQLAHGTYDLTKPLVLRSRDSGTNGFDVIWTGVPAATTVISGGLQVSGWRLTNAALNIWAAPVPGDFRTRQLYIDGVRASLTTGRPPVKLTREWYGYQAATGVMSHWRNPSSIDFVYQSQLGYMDESICPVQSIRGRSINMAQPCWNNSNDREGDIVGWPGSPLAQPTYVENARELLNHPGQFYLDHAARRLYYIPRPGEDMTTADVVAPALQRLIVGTGTPANPIHNIGFSNLQFSYATWLQPASPEGFSEVQAGYTITGTNGYAREGLCKLVPHGSCPYGAWTKEPANVQFTFDQHLTFASDRFVHLGAAGLDLGDGSEHATVLGCVFTDISGNGLELGGVDQPEATGPARTEMNTVSDNHFFGIPAEFHGGVPILAGYVAGTEIDHNQIDHIPYAAISLGWGGWLDKHELPPVRSYTGNNVIEDNLIFDFMEVLKDGGGIYTQGSQGTSLRTGLMVSGNVIHDQLDWGAALKSDDGSIWVTYSHNVLYNDTYDWDGPQYDYRKSPGHVSRSYGPELIANNWWQQGYSNYDEHGVIFSGNTIIAGEQGAPSSVVAAAGLEPGFQSLQSWIPEPNHPPTAPEEVSAPFAFDGTAYLTWHPSYDEGSAPVDSYTLQACPAGPGGAQACSASSPAPVTVPATQLVDTGYAVYPGLATGKLYVFTVTATSAAGSSIPSVPVDVRIGSVAPRLPSKPTQFHVLTGQRALTLAWYHPANLRPVRLMAMRTHKRHTRSAVPRVDPFVLSYRITSSAGATYNLTGQEQLIASNTGSRVQFVIDGLTPGKRYRFSVAAVNPAGTGPAVHSGWESVSP